jgi:hypothetical protein
MTAPGNGRSPFSSNVSQSRDSLKTCMKITKQEALRGSFKLAGFTILKLFGLC